jgi:uncharacterized protein
MTGDERIAPGVSASLGYVQDTGTPKGRGVFASRAIRAGEVVEICPALILEGDGLELPLAIRRVLFNWGRLAQTAPAAAIALGYGGIYNHANPANMTYGAVPETGCLRYVAARDIAADEELTINYNARGGGIESDDDCWFRAAGVVPWTG